MKNLASVIVLAFAIVAAGFLIGGRYEAYVLNESQFSFFIIDRYTGIIQICDRTGCRRFSAIE